MTPGGAVHLVLGEAVAVQHMHAGHKETDAKASIPRGDCKRFQLAKISAGSGEEEKGLGHGYGFLQGGVAHPAAMIPLSGATRLRVCLQSLYLDLKN